MAWGSLLWFDMWLAGMAGGAYIVAFLVNHFSGGSHKNLVRLALYAGVPLAMVGVLLVIIELGHPIWFWHLFTAFKPEAVMSMGIWSLTAWIIVSLIMMATWIIEGDADRDPTAYSFDMAGLMRKISAPLGWINLILAILVISYPAVLFAATSQPLWSSTFLFPAVFVASAICTGLALVILLAMVINAVNKSTSRMLNSAVEWLFGSTGWQISRKSIGFLAKGLIVMLVIDIAIMAGYAIWLSISAGEALGLLVTGALALPFWVAVVLLGVVVPLALLVINRGERLTVKTSSAVIAMSAVFVLLGGLALRIVITIGGQL